jgi:hypothetical protein
MNNTALQLDLPAKQTRKAAAPVPTFELPQDAVAEYAEEVAMAKRLGMKFGGVDITLSGRARFHFWKGTIGNIQAFRVPAGSLRRWVKNGCQAEGAS